MLATARTGADQTALARAKTALVDGFIQAGAERIEIPHLFRGDLLLDLYGEDLRARAFIYSDAERGNELCLRPDFTIPIALDYGTHGWGQERTYCYAGPVFRRQPSGQARPVEYVQAGIERFGDQNRIASDVWVFDQLAKGIARLTDIETNVLIGDLAIPFAALDSLDMPPARRAALRRHFWRPKRFQDLVRRAVTLSDVSDERQALLASQAAGGANAVAERATKAGEPVGLRNLADIAARVEQIANEQQAPRMPKADADLLSQIMGVKGPAHEALATLRGVCRGVGQALDDAIDGFAERLSALAGAGHDTAHMQYDAGFGRNLEYYDGFVFEIRGPGGQAHPPLAGGGRYDLLPQRMGSVENVPAIGGIIRPEAVLEIAR